MTKRLGLRIEARGSEIELGLTLDSGLRFGFSK